MAGARVLAAGVIALSAIGFSTNASSGNKAFTTDFHIEDCTFSTQGANRYFVLEPGYKLVLEGRDDGENAEVWITVLPDTQSVTLPGIGEIMTRVVEEREWGDGMLSEISRNFFAICEETGSVYYFGEEVDDYEDGQIVGHEGAWLAGVNGALPGIVMPGEFLVGARYYQEMAPGVAMDRVEHVKMGLTIEVPAGQFTDVVKVRETSALESNEKEYKFYAPGIGVIIDENLKLVEVFDPTP